MTVLTIQGYTVASEKPHNASFSFVGDEIHTLLEFVANIRSVALSGSGSINISDVELRRLVLSNQQVRNLVEENEELFADVISSSLTKKDIVAVGYRKKKLEVFRSLLDNPQYFEKLKERKNCASDERLWQQFFEKNTWIFGYGLSYVFRDALNNKKLEHVVQGHYVGALGKRVDALMKSRGAISSL